jgi:hypothetical protein
MAIAILLSTSVVSLARHKPSEDIAWLFYMSEGALNQLNLTDSERHHIPQVNDYNYLSARISPDGRWVIFQQNNDFFRRDTRGHRVEQITDFRSDTNPDIGPAWHDWFLIYVNHSLYRMQNDGGQIRHLGEIRNFSDFEEVSQDRDRILISTLEGENKDIYVLNIPLGEIRQLTDDRGIEHRGHWSINDDWIVFLSDQDGIRDMYQIRPDGTMLQPLDWVVSRQTFGHISPDRQWIVVDYEYPVGIFRSDGSEFSPLSEIPDIGNKELFEVWGSDSSGFITRVHLPSNTDEQEMYWNSIDGTERHLIQNSKMVLYGVIETEVSPQGNMLLYEVALGPSISEIQLVGLPLNGDPMVYISNDQARFWAWSRNGKWIITEMAFDGSRLPNDLARICMDDGRIERLTYTGDTEYPRYIGIAAMTELEWNWQKLLIVAFCVPAYTIGTGYLSQIKRNVR